MLNQAQCAKIVAEADTLRKVAVVPGLYLFVKGKGRAYWTAQFRSGTAASGWSSKGLGSFPDVTVKQAREKLEAFRVARRNGELPAPTRKAAAAVTGKTFPEAVAEWLAVAGVAWADKTRAGVERALCRLPLASKPLAEITTQDVLADVRDALAETPRQREDVRRDLARVLDFAAGREWVTFGPAGNPAKFEGTRREMWPKFSKSGKRHARVSRNDIPALYTGIVDGDTARALRFLIVTAARTGEVEGARWSEIFPAGATVLNADGDEEKLTGDTWIIPAERMRKGGKGKEHRVPLSSQAMEILGGRGGDDALLFGRLPANAMLNLLQKTHPDRTVHGCRSTFRDWVIRQTVPLDHGATMRDLAELALSHNLPGSSTVERSYARDGLLDLRRPLMQEWADFATGQ